MADDMRKNVFEQAMAADIASKRAAVRGGSINQGGLPSEQKPVARSSGRQVKPPRFQGLSQVNFGIEPDLKKALKLARATKGGRNSDICNAALRMYLADELALLAKEGLV